MVFFVGVAHRAQVLQARNRRVVAFCHGRAAVVRRLSPGDRVIRYAPKTDFEGAPARAFVARPRVTGAAPRATAWRPGMPAWVRDAVFGGLTGVPVAPLIERPCFIRSRPRLGITSRQSKVPIPEADCRLVAAAFPGAAP